MTAQKIQLDEEMPESDVANVIHEALVEAGATSAEALGLGKAYKAPQNDRRESLQRIGMSVMMEIGREILRRDVIEWFREIHEKTNEVGGAGGGDQS